MAALLIVVDAVVLNIAGAVVVSCSGGNDGGDCTAGADAVSSLT